MPRPPEHTPRSTASSLGTGALGEVPHQLPAESTRATRKWDHWIQQQLERFTTLVRPVTRHLIEKEVVALAQAAPPEIAGPQAGAPQFEVVTLSSAERKVAAAVHQKIAVFSKNESAVFPLTQEVTQLFGGNNQYSKRILKQSHLFVKATIDAPKQLQLVKLYHAFQSKNRAEQYTFLTEVADSIPAEFLQSLFVFLTVGSPQMADHSVLEQYYQSRISSGAQWRQAVTVSEHFQATRDPQLVPGSFAYASREMVFIRLHQNLQSLAAPERATLLSHSDDIFLSTITRVAQFMKIYGNAAGERKYLEYLQRNEDRSEVLDIAELRRVLDIFILSPTDDTQHTQTVISKAISLADALGMYDSQLRTALSAKYDQLAQVHTVQELQTAMRKIASVSGFALETAHTSFLQGMYEAGLNLEVINLIYELMIILQISNSDARLLAATFQALENILSLITTEPATQTAEEHSFMGSLGVFEAHFVFLRTRIAERLVDVQLFEKTAGSAPAQLQPLRQAGAVLAQLPLRLQERQEQQQELHEAGSDLDIAEESSTEQLLRVFKGKMLEVLEIWGSFEEAVESQHSLIEYFSMVCEQRLAVAKRLDAETGYKLHTPPTTKYYKQVIQMVNPMNMRPRSVRPGQQEALPLYLNSLQLGNLQYAAWTLTQTAPDSLVTPQQKLGLLVVAEAAVRGRLAATFNFSQLDLLAAKTMPVRAAALRAARREDAAVALEQESLVLLQMCLQEKLWNQSLDQVFMAKQSKAGEQARIMSREKRAREHLYAELQIQGVPLTSQQHTLLLSQL